MSNIADIPRRNAEAVEHALATMNKRILDQQIRVDSLVNTLSSLAARLNEMESANAVARVSSIGRGPTVKQ